MEGTLHSARHYAIQAERSAQAAGAVETRLTTAANAVEGKVDKTDISHSVDSNSQTTVASSQAVKTAYDKGVEAKNAADNAYNKGVEALTAANSARAFAQEKHNELEAKKANELVQEVLNLEHLNENKWYPVILRMPDVRKLYRFQIRRTLGDFIDSSKPVWKTRSDGFTLFCEWEAQPSGWGTYNPYVSRVIKRFEFFHHTQSPMLKIGQIYQTNYEYVYLRGGAKYYLYRGFDVGVEIAGANGYTWVAYDPQFNTHLPVIHAYDESLVPKSIYQHLEDSKANKTTTLAGYGIDDFQIKPMNSNTNVRQIDRDGIYSLGSGGVNLPDGDAYKVLHIKGGGFGWQMQMAFRAYSNDVYLTANRSLGSHDWFPWQKLLTGKDFSHRKVGSFNIIKLADGTMIQTRIDEYGGHHTQRFSFYQLYPEAFIEPPVVNFTLQYKSIWSSASYIYNHAKDANVVLGEDSDRTRYNLVFDSSHFYSDQVRIHVTAIGRWKQ